MKSLRLNRDGIGHVVFVFAVLFIGVVSLAGYKVATMNQVQDNVQDVSVAQGNVVTVPSKISTRSDLEKTETILDDGNSLAADLDDEQLDKDLTELL
jgi:hypothetical protein